MARELDARKAADRILLIFKEAKARPGHVLKEGAFLHEISADILPENFRRGIDYAIAQRWLEETDVGTDNLTIDGFSAANVLTSVRGAISDAQANARNMTYSIGRHGTQG